MKPPINCFYRISTRCSHHEVAPATRGRKVRDKMTGRSGGFVFCIEHAGGHFENSVTGRGTAGKIVYPEGTQFDVERPTHEGLKKGVLLPTGDFLYFEQYSGFWQSIMTPETEKDFSSGEREKFSPSWK